MNVRGAQRMPIMKEREKFRVARVERKRPRRRREKENNLSKENLMNFPSFL